jgi:RimJ/RimL family protein N-acetyltransferase
MTDAAPSKTGTIESSVHLRVFTEADLQLLFRFATEPEFSMPFEWCGYTSPEKYKRQWQEDRFLGDGTRLLAVAETDQPAIGWAMWRDPKMFERIGWCWEIGMVLAPEHRGRGVGTAAHLLLSRYLFDTTTVNRQCAYTEVGNKAEQRALEKCNFRVEGQLRDAGFRDGEWRDLLLYARLRDEEA